jgi:hypothetical protein
MERQYCFFEGMTHGPNRRELNQGQGRIDRSLNDYCMKLGGVDDT